MSESSPEGGWGDGQLDMAFVSVSQRLFGSFVLILLGLDEYFSCYNYYISKTCNELELGISSG